jgi:hypothetical protein
LTGSLRDFATTTGGLAVLSEHPLLKGLILHKGTSAKPSYPSSIGGLEVTGVVDLTIGYDSANPPTYKPSLPLSSGHMIQFRGASKDGSKITLTTRTSGTEPKVRTRRFFGSSETGFEESPIVGQIKYYLEGSGQNRDAVQGVLREVVRELSEEWMQANLNKLGLP